RRKGAGGRRRCRPRKRSSLGRCHPVAPLVEATRVVVDERLLLLRRGVHGRDVPDEHADRGSYRSGTGRLAGQPARVVAGADGAVREEDRPHTEGSTETKPEERRAQVALQEDPAIASRVGLGLAGGAIALELGGVLALGGPD